MMKYYNRLQDQEQLSFVFPVFFLFNDDDLGSKQNFLQQLETG